MERVLVWMFHVGRARHLGPGSQFFSPGQLSVEFVNVGGWLTYGILLWILVLSSWLLLTTG